MVFHVDCKQNEYEPALLSTRGAYFIVFQDTIVKEVWQPKKPSKEDFNITESLLKAGLVLEIPLFDHLIVNSKGDFFSFKQEGYMLEDRVIKRKVFITKNSLQQNFQEK